MCLHPLRILVSRYTCALSSSVASLQRILTECKRLSQGCNTEVFASIVIKGKRLEVNGLH